MAYEKSLIAETPSAVPTQPAVTMREPREVDPYKLRTKIGQNIISEEQAKPAVEPKAEETLTLSPAAAALARKEQRYRQQELDLKKEKEALEAERVELADLRSLKAKLAAKDYSDLEKQVPYDEYTNYLINKESQLTPEQKAIKELADKVNGVETAHKEDVNKRFEAAVNERRKAVKTLVETNAEYSSIKEMKAEEAVVKHILDTWEHDQVDLSPEEAAKEVEELLVERANKWSSLTKLKKQLDPNEASVDKKNLPPLKAPIKTLTNNMSVTGEIKRPQKPLGNMSDSERWAEARRRAEEKLQKGIRQ